MNDEKQSETLHRALVASQKKLDDATKALDYLETASLAAADIQIENLRQRIQKLEAGFTEIIEKYERNIPTGDEWEDGYEDALSACAQIAYSALDDKLNSKNTGTP